MLLRAIVILMTASSCVGLQGGESQGKAKAQEPAPYATPQPLHGSSPGAWLCASGWSGRAGMSVWGLDAEPELRPNPGDQFPCNYYLKAFSAAWTPVSTDARGIATLSRAVGESYAWAGGTCYAVAYLQAPSDLVCLLRLQHEGCESAVFLDRERIPTTDDSVKPVVGGSRAASRQRKEVRSGQEIHDDLIIARDPEPPRKAELRLTKGWHRLLIKWVHRRSTGEPVNLHAALEGQDGRPAVLTWQLADPEVPEKEARSAARLWPMLSLADIPANLPRQGEQLTLRASFQANPTYLPGGLVGFDAVLRVTMTSYDGRVLGSTEKAGSFPGTVNLPLGAAPAPGYYALHPELRTSDGRLIRAYPADGFTVTIGDAAQRQRLAGKELWNSYYYAFNSWDACSTWLERTGILKNIGSTPGRTAGAEEKWPDSQRRGLTLVGDFAADNKTMNNSDSDAGFVVSTATQYTRFFKAVNEIDGRATPDWIQTRTPEQWVQRARWQYENLHRVRPDAVCFSGSLYCSGVERACPAGVLSPRSWFKKCLELGLESWVDIWDVHCYPLVAPALEGPIANASTQSDQGVLEVLSELGRKNTKPFMFGEVGSLSSYGFEGLRWQAETAAKMVAWSNSRQDIVGIAFCAAHRNRRETFAEYDMAHLPGEAALITAGALIDGMPYRRITGGDPAIQAAWFGETAMAWQRDGQEVEWQLALPEGGPWLTVDVVGRAQPLPVQGRMAKLRLGSSPVYVLSEVEYGRLTGTEMVSSKSKLVSAPAQAVKRTSPIVKESARVAWSQRLLRVCLDDVRAARSPSFTSAMVHARLQIEDVADDGTMTVLFNGRSRMSMSWKSLSPADMASLAVDCARSLDPQRQAIAAFYCLVSGQDVAQKYLERSGDLRDEIQRSFEPGPTAE